MISYSATFQMLSCLERLEETPDEAFKLYVTRKTQAWFRRWGCTRSSNAAASPAPAPGAAPGAAPASTPAKDTAPVPSSDEEGAELISPDRDDDNRASSPRLALETLPSAGRA